jgi:arginine/lysine/ornithine decarboxylase
LLYREALTQPSGLEKVHRNNIADFNRQVEENKELAKVSEELVKFDLHQYDRYTIQGTNDASSIKLRFHIIAKHLGINPENIDKLN